MIKVGLIGFGRMGEKYLTHFQETNRWDVAYICDIDPEARKYAKEKSPNSQVVDNEQVIFEDPSVKAVALCTLANFRKEQIEKAGIQGKDEGRFIMANISYRKNQ